MRLEAGIVRGVGNLPRGGRHGNVSRTGIEETNAATLAKRPFLERGYKWRPVSTHNKKFQAMKRENPYFGYIDVEVEGVRPFVMFSNNDDRVAQTYFWYGPNAFESLSLRIWREQARRSRHIFDVGAFTGVYTLTAAHANEEAEVYCFEPIKRIFGRLAINLAANRLARRVKPFDVALSDSEGTTTMNVYQGHFLLVSGSSLVSKEGKEVRSREHVDTMRFDSFAEEHEIPGVDLVKIDVEQAETMVIKGMEKTIEAHRPELLVEVLSKEKLYEIMDLLSPHEYSFAVIDDLSQRVRVNDFEAQKGVRNVFFSPKPKAELEGFLSKFGPLPETVSFSEKGTRA